MLEKFPDIKKIAVLRSNSLGDYVFSLPALESLAAAYPHAEIVLLGKQWHADFLAQRPGPVDRVLVLPFITGVCDAPGDSENPGEIAAFLARARAERFDLCVQLYGGGRYSNPFITSLGGRYSIAMKAPDAPTRGIDRWAPYIYYYPEVTRYLEAVALAGAAEITRAPRLEVTRRDREEAARALPGDNKPLAILHPGATDTRRRWPAEKFAHVARALADAGCAVIISGSGNEKGICDRVEAMAGRGVRNLYGKLPLHGLTGALARAAVVVSNDTGPLHLARAVGAATVAVYWIGNYINAGPPDMTRHRSHLSWRLNCPVCGTNCIESSCPHRPSFVADIPSEEVVSSALELLSGQRLLI